jgi:hypothetical protein
MYVPVWRIGIFPCVGYFDEEKAFNFAVHVQEKE